MTLLGQKLQDGMQSRYNHRGHQAAGDVKPDAVVRSEAELIACPEKISTKE